MIPAPIEPRQDADASCWQTSRPGLLRWQASESTADGNLCSRSSEQSDGSKSAGKERRQRHRERYPPPPGPPPSPTPSRRRRKISPTSRNSSPVRSCERSTSEGERGRQQDAVRFFEHSWDHVRCGALIYTALISNAKRSQHRPHSPLFLSHKLEKCRVTLATMTEVWS